MILGRMCVFGLLAGAFVACSPASSSTPATPSWASDGSLPKLAWLAGSWVTEDGSTEEHWTLPRGGSMLGAGRSFVGGKTMGYEHLRIADEGGQIVYHAMPSGQAPTAFKLVESTEKRLVFEDPTHDFPQRVIYERVAEDRLAARIEGVKQGKAASSAWSMRRVARPGGW